MRLRDIIHRSLEASEVPPWIVLLLWPLWVLNGVFVTLGLLSAFRNRGLIIREQFAYSGIVIIVLGPLLGAILSLLLRRILKPWHATILGLSLGALLVVAGVILMTVSGLGLQ